MPYIEMTDVERTASDAKGCRWEIGAALAAECLATGKELLVTPEHASRSHEPPLRPSVPVSPSVTGGGDG